MQTKTDKKRKVEYLPTRNIWRKPGVRGGGVTGSYTKKCIL